MPSLMILSTPSLRLSTAIVCVDRISTASGVAKAGIIPSTPLNSLALIIEHLLSKLPGCFLKHADGSQSIHQRVVINSTEDLSTCTQGRDYESEFQKTERAGVLLKDADGVSLSV